MPTRAERQELTQKLFSAARDNERAEVKRLIEDGADVRAKDDVGMTPLHYAATGKGDSMLVQALINRGAKINAKDDDGMTPLHYAAQRGSADVMELLLENNAKANIGAEVSMLADRKILPLHLAALSGNSKAVAVLAGRKDVDINAQTAGGNTALHYASFAIGRNDDALASIALLKSKDAKDTIANKRGHIPAKMIKEAEEAIAARAEVELQRALGKFNSGHNPALTNAATNMPGNLISNAPPLVKIPSNAPALPGK